MQISSWCCVCCVHLESCRQVDLQQAVCIFGLSDCWSHCLISNLGVTMTDSTTLTKCLSERTPATSYFGSNFSISAILTSPYRGSGASEPLSLEFLCGLGVNVFRSVVLLFRVLRTELEKNFSQNALYIVSSPFLSFHRILLNDSNQWHSIHHVGDNTYWWTCSIICNAWIIPLRIMLTYGRFDGTFLVI